MMPSTLFDLSGKTALVTGASRGLGQAIAVGLAEAGAKVGITSRTLKSLEATDTLISRIGTHADTFELDVRDTSPAKEAVRPVCSEGQAASISWSIMRVMKKYAHLWILTRNSGIRSLTPISRVRSFVPKRQQRV